MTSKPDYDVMALSWSQGLDPPHRDMRLRQRWTILALNEAEGGLASVLEI